MHFAPYFNFSSLLGDAATTPPTVIAGADVADDKALFKDRIMPLAQVHSSKQRDDRDWSVEVLLDYTLDVFNVPLGAKRYIKDHFDAHTVDEIAEGFAVWVSTCATLKVAKAVDEGFHYRFESAVASGQLRPPLGIDQVAQFAANGTVPLLADESPWPPLVNMSKTRAVSDSGQENMRDYNSLCAII
ncbi:uncharacterized protein LOC125946285 [Dermacentor silvarum]|uniref:uncharacterized protein LOC125946285 n=1 Tax=Dermacentor silvarum TaxID=543639 RepID=UPI002100B52C|nr:uncharacterized protein LOC125946285 [Dermacentor silvarum]